MPREMDLLTHDMIALIKHLSAAVSEATRADQQTSYQQALQWSCALLLERYVVSGGRQTISASDDEKQVLGLHARHMLDELTSIARRSSELSRVVEQVRQRLARTDTSLIREGGDVPAGDLRHLAYWFEQLVAGSDPTVRRRRGVYFTPAPLVRYIVRSVDRLLCSELKMPNGLRSEKPRLCVVDPACGSGVFLLGVLAHLRSVESMACGNSEASSIVPTISQWMRAHRLAGIDVLPAHCGAARLLIERQLSWMNVAETSAGSWSIDCGNPLIEVSWARDLFEGCVPVIVGNPPYNNFDRQNRGDWILTQLDEYKRGLNEKKLNLNDDFIKFIRWAQYWIETFGRGVLAFVTNNTYLTGITHRRMRESLADTFDKIYILDLHGSHKRRETAPDGSPDKNVFGIQQGVAIGLFVKSGLSSPGQRISHADLWGSRDSKMEYLAANDVGTTNWSAAEPVAPLHFFVPSAPVDADEYYSWPRINEIFERHVSGVQTKRDQLFVGFTRSEVEQKVRCFLAAVSGGKASLELPRWLRDKAEGIAFDPQLIRPYMVAPFDLRWVYYDPRLLGRARYELLRHLAMMDNVALVFMRQTTNQPPYDHFLATNVLVSDRVFYSAHGAPFVAPLWLREDDRRVANLRHDIVAQIAKRIGERNPLNLLEDSTAAEASPARVSRQMLLGFVTGAETRDRVESGNVTARDVFHWIYAAVHDRSYRERYDALLRVDFPRVPWPEDRSHFAHVCGRGEQLAKAHLAAMAASVERGSESCSGVDALEMPAGYPRWESGRLQLAPEHVWPERVEQSLWEARVGGYRVLQRWLKQRAGRTIQPHQWDQFGRVIDALRANLRHMQ